MVNATIYIYTIFQGPFCAHTHINSVCETGPENIYNLLFDGRRLFASAALVWIASLIYIIYIYREDDFARDWRELYIYAFPFDWVRAWFD